MIVWKKIVEAVAAAAGAVASFFCGLPPIIWILLAVITLDYVTGIICGIMGKSPKTENGGLSSKEAFQGILRKALILFVVLLAALLDRAVSLSAEIEFAAVSGATCLWFIASEGMSILENAVAMGVPIPKLLLNMLELFKAKCGESKPPDMPESDIGDE